MSKNGVNRDVLIRYSISRDEFWWKNASSPWKMNIEHDRVQETIDPVTRAKLIPYKVSDLRDRALDLCGYEITHTNFGLSFSDLMKLDLATFEEVEDRVHEMAQQQSKSMAKFANAGKEAKANLLSRGK